MLFTHRLSHILIVDFKRSIATKSDIYLANQMKIYNDRHQYRQTLEIFHKNKQNIQLNTNYSSSIFSQVLKACSKLNEFQLGTQIHRQIESNLIKDSFILASLINFYIECDQLTKAETLFHSAKTKTLSMTAAMMKGYKLNNQPNKAIELFNQIQNPDRVVYICLLNCCAQLGSPDALTLLKQILPTIPKDYYSNNKFMNSLLDAFIKCGDIETANSLFEKTRNKTTELFGAMMTGYLMNNDAAEKVIDLFKQMKTYRIKFNEIICLIVIKALAKLGDYSLCKQIIAYIPQNIIVDDRIQKLLIDMWGKSGCVERAKEIFDKQSHPDQFTYAAMINSYGLNGMGIEANELYRQMPSKFNDEVTYICILNACSHSGLVNEARTIFENIDKKTYKIYTVMIDCLSRASFFDDAQQLIKQYESNHSPVLPMYMALLSGLRNNKNIQLAQSVYDRMKILFSESPNVLTSGSTLLANIYGSIGNMEKASGIQRDIHQSGLKKKLGVSWTVINGQIHSFRAHERLHPRSNDIYLEVKTISNELLQRGFKYDPSWITRPLEAGETVDSVLCGHSERLAIAWNFVVNPKVKRIQITKNLRVCGDCHEATKLIAQIRQCEIIVRDANRIHHFHTNGQCSCNDYF